MLFARKLDASVECLNTANGEETLGYLDNAAKLPDMVFLDINMPIMDGKACLKAIKKDTRFQSIPVIIYTTSANEWDRQQCLELGATNYLMKPMHLSELVDQLAQFFKKN